MFDGNEAQAQEILSGLNKRLDGVVESVAQATINHDQEFSMVSLGLAISIMPLDALIDLAFIAVLRLADQKVEASE